MRDAYDVLDDLNRAGVCLRLDGDRIDWRCDPAWPPVPGVLFIELRDHKAGILRILRDVPAGCPQPGICDQLGICWREIDHSACTYASPQRKEPAA